MNLYTVKITNGQMVHTMSAKGEGMTEQQVIEKVVSKQPWRLREAVAAGECKIEVIADVNNK